ncbi:MAG: 16S rRNA (uracil(1498)-N(3))-methyltransferase [Lachnospiraceae bacterium]|nr:16S rRNA (uracil(1498)-N(3))-methyltransferase [Lachnospiraceae bacterium]
MYHFFVEPSQVHSEEIEILGGDVNHISHVLRMKAGEEIVVSDGYGNEYGCRLCRFTDTAVYAAILEKRRVASELSSPITLFQCLPKGDKMELIIQKAVELGVSRIVPVASKRCVVKLDAKREANKRKRWQAVAESAAKQSGRAMIPTVQSAVGFSEALLQAKEQAVCLIPYECAGELLEDGQDSAMERTRKILSHIEKGQSIGVFIGPEGGFEKEEVEAARKMGAQPVSLGRRILRTETAGLCILSVLMFQLEE